MLGPRVHACRGPGYCILWVKLKARKQDRLYPPLNDVLLISTPDKIKMLTLIRSKQCTKLSTNPGKVIILMRSQNQTLKDAMPESILIEESDIGDIGV